jgi:hypothetical protein
MRAPSSPDARRASRSASSFREVRRIQPGREFSPSKSKQNQTNLLVFAWICLVESGLFNGLRVKKQKNFPISKLAR